MESYEEDVCKENRLLGTLGAAETGTLFKNPDAGPPGVATSARRICCSAPPSVQR